MVLLLLLWVSLVLRDYQSFCVSLLVCSVDIYLLSMFRLFVDFLRGSSSFKQIKLPRFWRQVTMACFVLFGRFGNVMKVLSCVGRFSVY